MGYGFVNIGDDRTKGDTPSYTYDASGHITAVDFGNGLRLVKATTEGLSNGWYIEIDGGNILWAGDVAVSGRPCLLPGQAGETYLGYTNYLWRAVYATLGEIQTSDRAEKTDIHYLTDPVAAISDPHSEDSPDYDGSPAAADEITYADIEDFVRNLSAATFVYKSGVKDGEVEPAAVQLGLIADDICDHKLYPYIGVTEETESGTKRGLQPIPLAVAALAMCKRQAEQIAELTDRIAKLEATK